MENFDFKKFYDNQHDYVSFRNDPEKRHEYDVAVNWKTKNLSSLVPEGLKFSNILEVGCAFGILLNKIADSLSVSERIGIDISVENIKMARDLYPDCTFFQGTTDTLKNELFKDTPGKVFGLVVLSDIVEHIPDDFEFMKEISKFSSYLLLNLPLEKCYMTRNRNYGVDDPSGHLRKYNRSDAEKLIKSTGYDIISSFCTNSHFDKEHFKIYRLNRNIRLKKKSFLKRTFWLFYYLKLDIVRVIAPWLYVKIFGSNYFALLKTVDQNKKS
jgi:SAM-dependent methyltransferase